MKNATLAFAMLAVLSLSACANGTGTWTPQADGRTAGNGQVEKTAHHADTTFSNSLRK